MQSKTPGFFRKTVYLLYLYRAKYTMTAVVLMRKTVIYFFLPLLLGYGELSAQYLPEHINNEGIYDFLDEMANEQLIILPSVVRPYSRELIVKKLRELSARSFQMTSRQRHLLEIYRYHFLERTVRVPGVRRGMLGGHASLFPLAYEYHDRGTFIRAKPILEGHYHANNRGDVKHFHYGVEVSSFVGESWSAWASLVQVAQDGEVLARPGLLNRNEGGTWSHDDEIPDDEPFHRYNDIRGGMAYSWEWGSVAVQKEHLTWGDHYHAPNILDISPNTPSYPMVALNINTGSRLSFHYHHGWLNSMVAQDTIIFEGQPDERHPKRYEYHNKFFAGNLLTVMALEGLHLSAGNAIVYSTNNIFIGNFIPFMVFRSLEPSQADQSSGHVNNTMIYLNVSSRQIKHLHLYASFFTNSFVAERVFDAERTNYNSTKVGARLSNWPVRDTDLTFEYTFTKPNTFEHRTPIITYAHKNFNMGHYLGANANDLYASVGAQPWHGLALRFCYSRAQKGNLYPHSYGYFQDLDPYMEEVAWRNTSYTLEARYTLYNNIGLFARVRHMNVEGFDVTSDHHLVDYSQAQEYLDKFSPRFHHGETTTISFGFYMR